MLLCILSTVTLSFSQVATTSLRGTIKDPSGALVPGAKITITDAASGTSISKISDNGGAYVFAQIPPAKYTILISAAGFGTQTKTAELLVNQPATIDFALSVQTNTVSVDVSATAQTLNVTDASLGNAVGNDLIQALPSETRNVPDLLALQPGVLYLPTTSTVGDSRSGAVNGGRSDQGNITIDGIDDNDQVNGTPFTGVLRQTQDSIQEFRVVTGGSNADAGRSSGAQVSMLTKSGTNKIHGAAYWYNRPTMTVANDWFNKQAEISSGLPNIPGKLIRNIFGADLGGPIKKDRVFLFMNYEGSRLAENAQVTRTAPTSTYQQGIIRFPGGQWSASDVASLDTTGDDDSLGYGCQVCNSPAYPNPPGPNPNALSYFNSMPAANLPFGGDGGYNTGNYSFSSHNPQQLDTYIAKLDYILSDRHRIFVRGQLQKDSTQGVEYFPGQGPSSITVADNKGLIAGYTWTITPNLINDIRYGYIRQGGGSTGVGKGDYVDFRFLSTATSESRSSITSIPVNNLIDNVSWTKGKHTIGFGFNWRLVHQNHSSDANSYNGASSNPYWLSADAPGLTASGSADNGFANSYDIAFANLAGGIPSVTHNYNYHLDSATTGSALADGDFLDRHFSANEYEGYVQDAFRLKPNLTFTVGLRYTYLQTPWETKGQEVVPTVDTHAWFSKRESAAQQGQIFEDLLSFTPAGNYYNQPGFWNPEKKNFAPRFAVAWSPSTHTSVRAGWGLFFDHFGESLINTFDQNGSYGMSSSVTNAAGQYQIEGKCPTGCSHPGAPRFTDRNTLPNIGGGGSSTVSFPFTPASDPVNGFAITWGLDSKMKTPYSETFDLSVQHEFPGGFTFEAAYVGRLGKRLLQNLDLAQPVDYVDPQGGGDYFAAGTLLSKAVDANGGNSYIGDDPSNPHVDAIPYFEHVFSFLQNAEYDGESATQTLYNWEWAPYRYNWGATTSLSDVDFYCYDGCPDDWQSHFWQSQFSSLYALSNVGSSYYHAGQLTMHHPMSHGLAFDFSYTLSHSIDMGSDSERNALYGGGSFSDITNAWKPELNRGSSDFDTRHLITANYVYELPLGRGKTIAGTANTLVDSFFGGWQLSGIAHWTSGLPWSLFEPGWTTNWEIESYGVVEDPSKVKMHKHIDQNGAPQYFADGTPDDPDGIQSGVYNGTPVRLPYPGEAGQRNNFRGDGAFNIDSGLAKNWKIREYGALKFAWEVYNVTNSVRFDAASIGSGLTGGGLGEATSLLSSPRRMQFSLRFDF
ncbi:MAG: carboxypeptidase regulatory-like domain-containing protein [Acidobacteria bacterium]|nr:carboxypeptidase regulatory-like domain-containing protein [Acidobacteriota bacterium]